MILYIIIKYNINGNNNKKNEKKLRSIVAICRHAESHLNKKWKLYFILFTLFDIYIKENNNENPKK